MATKEKAEIKEEKNLDEQQKEFASYMIKFFDASTTSGVAPIKALADIQEKFPEQYAIMQRTREDPSLIIDNDSIPDKVKSTMLLIILKASKLGTESQRVFEMSVKEKRELVDRLEDFSKFIKDKLEELVEKGVEK